MKPTVEQIETALDVLGWLSEDTDDGRLRDDIGFVRHSLYIRIEESE